jgi:hypothetical protein
VYDSYSAFSILKTPVQVKKLIISTEALANKVAALLNNPSNSQDTNAQYLNIGTAESNTVNCLNKNAAKCAALKRKPCALLSNSCGGCIDGTIGSEGPGNEKCILDQPRGNPNIQQFTGEACTTASQDTACRGFDMCGPNNKCYTPPQSCINNCNDKGICSFISSNTGQTTATCLKGSTNCQPKCTCNTGFYGISCETSEGAHQANVGLRSLLIGNPNYHHHALLVSLYFTYGRHFF